MLSSLKKLLNEGSPDFRRRLTKLLAFLVVFNLGAWGWAFIAFNDKPGLIGVALVVYSLGLRHAVDADHIAAIDNVTRKLMQSDQRPIAVGFYFAMGHSAVIVVVCALVAVASEMLDKFEAVKSLGGAISTVVSILFLFAIAMMNIAIFVGTYDTYRKVRRGEPCTNADVDLLLNKRGLLSKLFKPLFNLVTQSWHMLGLGFLFGLGFDTATEVATFGVAATQVAKGVSLTSVLVFPILFAAGMSLVDTIDGVVMLRAYDWAFVRPIRKLYYNLSITLVSVLVAVLVASIEALGLISEWFDLDGGGWSVVVNIRENFNGLGFIIIALFVAAWALSYVIYKIRKLDEIVQGAEA